MIEMYFCPKCGAVMIVKNVEGISTLICVKCGYKKVLEGNLSLGMKKTTVFTKYVERREGVMFDIPPMAIFDESISCPHCGKRGVYYWRKQVSSAESSDSIIKTFKCSNCGYTWIETE